MNFINWIKSLFSRTSSSNDMRTTAIDNPLDYREDGSIRPGDPAYDAMMELLNSGESALFVQKSDGTWDKASASERLEDAEMTLPDCGEGCTCVRDSIEETL